MQKSAEAFRTISEVAAEIDVPKHVLRFWEGKFTQLKPMKRGGGRRYYRPEDVDLLKGIRQLLYGNGYTIKGVQKLLREQGVDFVKSCVEERGSGNTAENAPIIPDLAQETARRAANPSKKMSALPKSKTNTANPIPKDKELGLSGNPKMVVSKRMLQNVMSELEACKKIIQKIQD